MAGVNLMSLVYFPSFGMTYIITGVPVQIMVEFLGALHKPKMICTSRDIGEIVKKVALVAQVIAFDYL